MQQVYLQTGSPASKPALVTLGEDQIEGDVKQRITQNRQESHISTVLFCFVTNGRFRELASGGSDEGKRWMDVRRFGITVTRLGTSPL